MRYDIQFAKIDVNKNARMKKTMLAFFGFLILSFIALFSVLSVRAYFTATAKKNGNLKFGTIEVALTNASGNAITASSFKTAYLSDVMPGSTLSFTDIKVKNTGTFAEYVLLNLDVEISGADSATKTLHYNEWYNVDGVQVDVNNMAINETKPTLIASGSSATANINWKVPGEPVGNEYLLGTTKVSITAYASQTYLADAVAYADAELYASYFIVKNAPSIAQDYELTYTGTTPTSDPLRKLVTSKNLLNIKDCTGSSDTFTYSVSDQVITRTAIKGVETSWTIQKTVFNDIIGTTTLNPGTYVWKFYQVSGVTITNPYITLTKNSGETLQWYSETSITLTESVAISEFRSDLKYCKVSESQQFKMQIERGSTVSAYAKYGAIEDAYDSTTNTVTRNVGKMEFTGTESWREMNMTSNYERFVLAISDMVPSSYAVTNICETDNPNAWNSYKFVFQVDSESNIRYYRPFYTGFLKGVANNANWKTWLRERNANGDPVTVWYVLTTPTTETVLTSKNLYNGREYMYNNSATSKSNISQNATIDIGNFATDLTSTYMNLGSELFNYLIDKEFTISYKIYRHTDDNIGNVTSILGVGIYDENMSSIVGYTNNYIPDVGVWETVSITIPDQSTKSYADRIYRFRIWAHQYSASTSGIKHFEIKDFQIEIGESPTDFERYDPTVYQRVNGVALRQVGTVKDTYNANTKTITRNVGKYELTGEETETQMALHSKIYDNGIRTLRLDVMNAVAARSAEVIICSHAQSVLFGDIYSNGEEGVSVHNEEPGHIYLRILNEDLTTLDAWRSYLAKEYANGNPVTIWCQLATATTETLS